ncbi:RNA pseudouridylate synthase domain-containing protein 2-like isoform X1 [Rhopalosiphum maidis]|uniref:RNA pseudouridylate synthase domain-containing protein 2-like isoform X1 n=2 Tax=Rhopalosiphum maidis TaxID=43146 RepID=UPI000EFDC403|nr:RNA pseudouridylate synthase domain-containing protein 2-like isoform X1 [Rhopalosiphum maidis]
MDNVVACMSYGRIGFGIQRFIKLFSKNSFAVPQKKMENNLLQYPALLIRNKSDVGVQCSTPNGLETTDCKSDEDDCQEKPDLLQISKRKLDDQNGHVKKPKKVKLDPVLITRPGYSAERFDETSYYIENGLRKVYPYYFTFTTYTKGRWVGRTLMDVFGEEFRAHSSDEYERHIEKGSLTINNERVTADYVLKHNDLLANVVHRHEVPVANGTIDVIHLDDDIVVVNKPSSIPVHPCGRYRHNTVIFVLAKEHGLRDLKTIHRLDRLTSGVLMFGRTQNRARTLEAQIRDRKVNKQYVCRVDGRFPESVECEQPIEVISYKIGVCKVSPSGKQCSTSFQLIGYNEKADISVVLCKPRSGRMHQIRVHLQYLGYPIQNDPLYNDTVFGPEKGRAGNFGKTDEQLVQDLIHAHNAENWSVTDDGLPIIPVVDDILPVLLEAENGRPVVKNCATVDMSTQTGIDVPDVGFDETKLTVDAHCQECKIRYKDPKPADLVMYLHALKYSGPDWAYETPMPAWADVNWQEP